MMSWAVDGALFAEGANVMPTVCWTELGQALEILI